MLSIKTKDSFRSENYAMKTWYLIVLEENSSSAARVYCKVRIICFRNFVVKHRLSSGISEASTVININKFQLGNDADMYIVRWSLFRIKLRSDLKFE